MPFGWVNLPGHAHPQMHGGQNPVPSTGQDQGPVNIPSRLNSMELPPLETDHYWMGTASGPEPSRHGRDPRHSIEHPIDPLGSAGALDPARTHLIFEGFDTDQNSPVMGHNTTGDDAYIALSGPVDRGSGNGIAAAAPASLEVDFRPLTFRRRGALRFTFGSGAQRYPSGEPLKDVRILPQTRRVQVAMAQPKMNAAHTPLLTRWRRPKTFSSTTPTLEPDYAGGGGSRYGSY